MAAALIKVLLVEDSASDALIVREELAIASGVRFVVTHAVRLADALQRLKDGTFDVVLLDLGLPDSDGMQTFERLQGAAPGLPVIILSGRNDEMMAMQAVQGGAQDYLMKGHAEENGLVRAIRYGLERARTQETIAAHARQQQALAALGHRALAGTDVGILFDETVALVARTLGVEFCKLLELLPSGDKLLLRAGVGWREHLVGRAIVDADAGSAAGQTLRADEPVIAAEPGTEPRFSMSPLLREHGVVSGVTVMIPGPRHPWGALGAHTAQRRVFTPHEVTFLQTIAHVLGEAIERKTAEQALQESDARFHQVVENIHEALWMLDVDTQRVVWTSPRYAEIWGETDATLRAAPDAWIKSVSTDDRARMQQAIPAMQRGTGQSETYRIVRSDGAVRWIRHRTFAARDNTGRVRWLIAVAEDTTEQKKLEEQFLRAQRLEAIGTLASGVAHDLNNILAPVLMAAEVLSERAGSARDRELLSMMAQGAERATNTVRQLLMFSRGAEGRRGVVELRLLVKEMVCIMRETFPREITIVECTETNLWPVIADATQLHQVLMNLCVNARDAMPGGGTITIGAANVLLGPDDLHIHADARPNRYTVLTVSDTGDGIPAEIINRVFDPFFTTKALGKGSGLGLSTGLGIIRSHGGFITVQSTPGRGTVFRGYLPAASETVTATQLQAPPPAAIGRGELVLVVDDEVAILESTREILEQYNYRVLTATDGRMAMNVLQTERGNVRLVITDMSMPVMSGVALVRALREVEPDLKVIASSGLDDEDKRAELAALGVNDVLIKPFYPAQLLGMLRRQLSTGRTDSPFEQKTGAVA